MRGEVNPADLFTKHLQSADRVADLLDLMGCQYAGGRADGAPQLRRELDTRNQGILSAETEVYDVEQPIEHEGHVYPSVWYEGRYVAEAYLHPTGTLPHFMNGNLDALFPRAVPGEQLEEAKDAKDPMEQRGEALGRKDRGVTTVGRRITTK